MASLLGLLVNLARFVALLNHTAHSAIADLDGHVIDSSVFWQRKSVHSFDFLRCHVFEGLRDLDAGDESADGSANVSMLQRARAGHYARGSQDVERAGTLAGSGRDGWFSGESPCEDREK